MTISRAIEAVTDEYDAEAIYARDHAEFDAMMMRVLHGEYEQIDRELPSRVAHIAGAMGVPVGTALPSYVYQVARMCFRLGMHVQRKLDHPEQETTSFWRSPEVKFEYEA